jgi:tetratricopeptide (TPR) repeat protein
MIPEITDLGEQAIVNRQSLLDTLIEANEAAGALALPRLGDPGEPIMAALLVERAEIHRAARRYDEAITDLTQVLELDPGRNDIRAVREKLLHEMRNNHE